MNHGQRTQLQTVTAPVQGRQRHRSHRVLRNRCAHSLRVPYRHLQTSHQDAAMDDPSEPWGSCFQPPSHCRRDTRGVSNTGDKSSGTTASARGQRLTPRDLPRTPQLARARLASNAQVPSALPLRMAHSGGAPVPAQMRGRAESSSARRATRQEIFVRCRMLGAGASSLPPAAAGGV